MVRVFDIEQYPNIHYVVFIDRDSDEKHSFMIFKDEDYEVNQIREYQAFLKTCTGLIGYNNIDYDYHLIDYIIKCNPLKPIDQILNDLESLSQRLINEKVWLPEWKHRIPQLDLLRIWHFNNVARATSLKSLQVAMRWHNVQDLPFPPGTYITREMMETMDEYCTNDVASTKAFYMKSKGMIETRRLFQKTFGFKCTNYSDVKIGQKINAITYSKKTGIPYKQFKDKRTYRSSISVDDCIAPFIEFQSDYFKRFITQIRTKSFKPDEEFRFEVRYGGKTFIMAKGGLHSVDKAMWVKAEDCHLQEDDVAGMYPKCLIHNKYYPQHLGPAWLEGMTENYNYRTNELKPLLNKLKRENKKGSAEYKSAKSMADGLKLALNGGGYGKTGSMYSWQYDPKVMFQTTITGQLSLLMLVEAFVDAGIEVVSANTDGVVSKVKKDQWEKYQEIRDWWQRVTGFVLERTVYNQLIFSNVNNYIAEIVEIDGFKYHDIKFKGWFEIDKDWHKNHSGRIISIAWARYFLEGIPVEETISNHIGVESYQIGPKTFDGHGIYDFCYTEKVKKGQDVFWGSEKVQQINRYYMSRNGRNLRKVKMQEKDRDLSQETLFDVGTKTVKAKWTKLGLSTPVEIMNRFEQRDDYHINQAFYVNEANKKIHDVMMNKLVLE